MLTGCADARKPERHDAAADQSGDIGSNDAADGSNEPSMDKADVGVEKAETPDVPLETMKETVEGVVEVPAFETPADLPPDSDAGGLATCPVGAVVLPEPPCAGLCGNGARDMCTSCPLADAGLPEPPCSTGSEICDGADDGGFSCSGIGYSGGTGIKCGAWCGLDARTCSACETGPGIVGCTRPAIDTLDPTALAVAASDTEIAIVWVSDRDASGLSRVRFARFKSDLTLIAESSCLGGTSRAAYSVAVARSPSGWIVGIGTESGVDLVPLDAMGAPRAGERFIYGAAVPFLFDRPAGAPLLAYAAGSSGLQVSQLKDDATAEWTSTAVSGFLIEPMFTSGVFTGDSWLVATRGAGATVVPVATDGTVGAAKVPGGGATEYPNLAWTGSEARMTWADFGATPSIKWARLDKSGDTLGTIATIGSTPTYYDPAPVAAIASDTIAIMPGYTGRTGWASHLDWMKVDAAGSAGTPTQINRDPNSAFDYHLARRGTEIVVAWLSTGFPGRINLARLAP